VVGHTPILARERGMMEAMPLTDERDASTVIGLAVAAFGPIGVAALVVPYRGDLDSANLAR
jgi:hypothetical protein